jgi:hypothetical protein
VTTGANLKVTAKHLNRDAYLYIRQSTVRQVFENTESTQRQYALQQRAVALAGLMSMCMLSIAIWGNRAHPQLTAKVSSGFYCMKIGN